MKKQVNASLAEQYRAWLDVMKKDTKLSLSALVEQAVELRYQQYLVDKQYRNSSGLAGLAQGGGL
jgi:hypothetical protein